MIHARSADSNRTEFTAELTEGILRVACERAGLDPVPAELMRLGENALYRLQHVPVVVRIARTLEYLDDARKEVRIAGWLNSIEFPAVRLYKIDHQPFEVLGHPVTFWRYIEGKAGSRRNIEDLGGLLRRLHSSHPAEGLDLPIDDVLGRVSGRIEKAPVPTADKDFLLSRCQNLSVAIEQLDFPLPPTVIHGDAHVQNLMVHDDGISIIDFERFGWGQPEWDLSVTATEYETAGWWTADEYKRFAQSYGFDVTEWEGFSLLRSVNEIKMTTWIMQNIRESAEIAKEYERRMRSIRTGRGGDWVPY